MHVPAAMIVPTARVAHLGAAAATAALAALPLAVVLARGGSDLTGALVVLALGTAAGLAWSCDDPAAELLGSAPVGAATRSAVRVACVTVVLAGVCAIALAAAASGPGLPPDLVDRVPEAATAALVALAVGFVANRRGERAGGAGGVLAGILVPSFVAALAVRWPDHLPTFEGGDLHGRWWVLAAAAGVVAARAARDPFSR